MGSISKVDIINDALYSLAILFNRLSPSSSKPHIQYISLDRCRIFSLEKEKHNFPSPTLRATDSNRLKFRSGDIRDQTKFSKHQISLWFLNILTDKTQTEAKVICSLSHKWDSTRKDSYLLGFPVSLPLLLLLSLSFAVCLPLPPPPNIYVVINMSMEICFHLLEIQK